MIFGEPVPFTEALESRLVRTLMPTTLRSRGLARLGADITERAFFSAGVTELGFLAPAYDAAGALLEGTGDLATLRLGLKQVLAESGYQPALGERGTILDLSSDARLNLILETNVQQMQGYGSWAQGQDEDVLDLWPAQELFRAEDREEPRDWPARWTAAGGRIFGGRMIALKKPDEFWEKLSHFGQPWPPFHFNSGMDVRDITRDEAMKLGLIDRDTKLAPQTRDVNEGLRASPQVRAAALRDALESTGLGTFNREGVFVVRKRRAA